MKGIGAPSSLSSAVGRLVLSKMKWTLVCCTLVVIIIIFIVGNSHPDGRLSEERPANLSEKRPACVDYRRLKLASLPQGDPLPVGDHNNTETLHSNKISTLSHEIEGVEKFVFFIGYPRSSHSIVGSMMDAHPNMLIAHEYNLFREWDRFPEKHSQKSFIYNSLYKNSVNSAKNGWRSKSKGYKGYTLGLDYPWQARFKDLKVIGDKSAAVTLQRFLHNPERFKKILDKLRQTVGIPLRVIHVVRNPYDMISTRLLYSDSPGKKTKLPATELRKHCNHYGLIRSLNRTFHIVDGVQKILDNCNLTVLDVHHADLVRDPRRTITMICRFLGLPFPSDYLDACEKKCYKKPSKTRLFVDWPKKMVEEVYRLTKPYKFLWRYSFNGN